MDVSTDYFDRLPDEVIQIIFSAISDCKSLVRCMSVSKAFRQQSMRVSSLSIVCPGNFSSYEERLQKIFSMVKLFRNLQSLVVRVGQPKEEPPSWARCMRYAEIGGSVEKFVFMAAKSGDFSELDFALLGLENVADDRTFLGETNSSAGGRNPDVDTRDRSNLRGIDREENESGTTGAWRDVESDEETAQRIRAEEGEKGSENDGKSGHSFKYSKFLRSNACFLRGPAQRRQLSDFSLRQVIAPSNDVLNRMLPVIHFAIVQGLNELRDSIPAFVSEFPDLRRFLLVDMVESITVFMREHHIQEIRALYLETLNDCDRESTERVVRMDPHLGETSQGESELQLDGGGAHCAKDTGLVNSIDAKNGMLEGRCDLFNERDVSSEILEDCLTRGREGVFRTQTEDNGETTSPYVAVEHEDHSWTMRSIVKDSDMKNNELPDYHFEDGSCGKYIEQRQGAQNSQFKSPEFNLQVNTATIKGKGKLLDHHNFCSEMEVSDSSDEASCTFLTPLYDRRSSGVSDYIGLKDSTANNSSGQGPSRNATAILCVDCGQAQVVNPMSDLPSSGDSEDGSADVEEYFLGCFNGRNKGVGAAELCHGSSQFQHFRKLVKGSWDATCHYRSGAAGELNTASTERDNDHLLQLRYVEGWDGRSEGPDGDNFRVRDDIHRFKSCKFSREGKVDMASRHPFKRCPKFDNCRVKDRNIRTAHLKRREESLLNFDSGWQEDTRGYRCLRFMGRMERAELAVKGSDGNAKNAVATKVHLGVHTRDTPTDRGVFCLGDMPSGQAEACSSWSDECLPGTSGDASLFCTAGRESWKDVHVWEQSMPKEAGTASIGAVNLSSPGILSEENAAGTMSSNSGKQYQEVALDKGRTLDTAEKEVELVETSKNDKLVAESTSNLELQDQQMGDDKLREGSRDVHSESFRLSPGRQAETEDWRYIWRDRMRRLRNNLRDTPEQGEHDGNQEERRERTRELLRKQQRQLEKDALSFDYTFWRAEHVGACNYTLSDVSMCIATHAPRPLKDTDKESLKHAALAGPLLVATFSHVNKHHTGHNL